MAQSMAQPVLKKVLKNGLTVLVRSLTHVPKVSVQLRYPVGSRDEETSEKGLAHLIEHMIFKGTNELLSETDIAALTHKLSGYANAFTSYDYTAYIFDLPSHHWQEAFPVLADCMNNARFNEQMLNSELKAVIQELKMGKDNYSRALWQYMMASIFYDHPYHYPIIGFKQDLWNMTRDGLFAFYKKHYVPNNAVLVVVGDVDPQEVFESAEQYFAAIPADPSYTRKELYHGRELAAQSVVLHRDIQQPYGAFAFTVPGLKEKKQYELDVLSAILCDGKSSRLSKKLVDELQLVTKLSAFALALEEATVFMIFFFAKDESKIDEIRAIIAEEIEHLKTNGFSDSELTAAVRQVKVGLISLLEHNQQQASMIAQDFLITGDESHTLRLLERNEDGLREGVMALLCDYFHPYLMHSGRVLPLTEQGREQWKQLQQISDAEDARILQGRTREIPSEPVRYADTVAIKEPKEFEFTKPEKYTLSNGIRIFQQNVAHLPLIDIAVSLGFRTCQEPENLPGAFSFLSQLLTEGTKNYPGLAFAQELERYGITLTVNFGNIFMTLLKEDIEKGLELLQELLMRPELDEKAVEKVRAKMLTVVKSYQDNPQLQANLLLQKKVYKDHPYSKNVLGSEESFTTLSREDLVEVFNQFFTSDKVRIAVIGDLQGVPVADLLERFLGQWVGPKLSPIDFPELAHPPVEQVKQYMNRDQIILIFAGLSISRLDPDYDKLRLFDQIFSGSSMSSKLFKLREETGLFYSISGSLTGDSDEQPGIVMVQTMVSQDRLEEAKQAIRKTMEEVIDTITEKELEDAKRAILEQVVTFYATNKMRAVLFLSLDRFNRPEEYLDNRADDIARITLEEVKEAARKVLVPSRMITIEVGRV